MFWFVFFFSYLLGVPHLLRQRFFSFFLICKNQHCAQFCKYDHHYNKEKESSSVGNVVIFLTQTNQNSMIFCQEMWDTLETLVALQFCFANLNSCSSLCIITKMIVLHKLWILQYSLCFEIHFKEITERAVFFLCGF